MSAWTGRPVLAMLSVAQIPAVASPSALAGLTAGVLAAFAAARHDAVGEREFATALRDAQENHDYDYSHQFAVAVDAATELLRIAGGLT